MDDLVRSTGVSRHGIYSFFGGKRALFLACFERYQVLVVTPAFEKAEEPNASFSDIEAYFEYQISMAETVGLPGPGCFVCNSITEVAPHDADVFAETQKHNDRLRDGFANVVRNSCKERISEKRVFEIAETIVVFANGLWATSRVTANAQMLRDSVSIFLSSIKEQLQ